MTSDLSSAMLDRRGFIAAAAATALAGCKARDMIDVRILFSDTPGTIALNLVRIFATALGKVGVNATVESVTRGAGKMAAQTLAEGPRDGSLVGQLFAGLLYAEFGQQEPARNPLTSFEWIGNFGTDARALVVSEAAGVSTFEQFLKRDKPFTIPVSSTHGPGYTEAAIIRHVTGAKIEAVPGFSGGSRNLAFVSGEVDAIITSLDSMSTLMDMPGTKALLLTNDVRMPPGTAGIPPGGLPVLRDVAHGPDAAVLVQLMEAYAQLNRMFALPPATPAEVVTLWRKRFQEVTSDPDFRRKVNVSKFEMHYRSGDLVAEQIAALTRRQPEIVPALHRALDR